MRGRTTGVPTTGRFEPPLTPAAHHRLPTRLPTMRTFCVSRWRVPAPVRPLPCSRVTPGRARRTAVVPAEERPPAWQTRARLPVVPAPQGQAQQGQVQQGQVRQEQAAAVLQRLARQPAVPRPVAAVPHTAVITAGAVDGEAADGSCSCLEPALTRTASLISFLRRRCHQLLHRLGRRSALVEEIADHLDHPNLGGFRHRVTVGETAQH